MKGYSSSQVEKIPWTDLQGQYLAFIRAYTLIHRCPPAEVDFQRFFQVAGPTVHRMLIELDRRGLISRQPRQARSIRLLVPVDDLPPLREPEPVKTPLTGY